MKSKLRKLLIEKNFVFTAETSPPDSGNAKVVLNQIACLKNLANTIKYVVEAGAKSYVFFQLLLLLFSK